MNIVKTAVFRGAQYFARALDVKNIMDYLTNKTALTSAATIALDATLGNVFTLTPAHNATINCAAVSNAGLLTLIITTEGTTPYTITFGTGFVSKGVLRTGNTTARVFVIRFVSNGTSWIEVSRTPSQNATLPVALTPGAEVALDCDLGEVFTLVPGVTGNINATHMVAARHVYLVVTTSGTDSFTLTFNTGFKSTGTLATGTSTGKIFVVHFISNGTDLIEVSRTTAI